jgi:GNAT superfamily N-acetyltransferase
MASDTRTRLAGTRDRRALVALDPLATSDLARREHIDAALAARRCWVAERAGGVVGYALLTRNFFGRDFLELLYVAGDSRRSGAGGALLAAVEAFVGAYVLFTSTNESNAAMRALLGSRGYVPSGRIENLDPDDPELVFVKFPRG